jgi:hypothetical protein
MMGFLAVLGMTAHRRKQKGGAAVDGETANCCPAERKLHFRSFPSLNLQFNQSPFITTYGYIIAITTYE